MNLRSILTILTLVLTFSGGFSQTYDNPEKTYIGGDIKIYKDHRIDTLILRTIKANEFEQKIKGYRIQIFLGSNRKQANKIKSEFLIDYPREKIYLVYKQPYFKLLVGDYRNRIEAQKMYHTLVKDEDYTGVLIVPDKIELPTLRYVKPY